MRFSEADLIDRALQAVDALHERARTGPVARTAELRFLLAFLANHVDRGPLDDLWRALGRDAGGGRAAEFGRLQTLANLVGFIRNTIEQRRGR
jgi:hypothetical protein